MNYQKRTEVKLGTEVVVIKNELVIGLTYQVTWEDGYITIGVYRGIKRSFHLFEVNNTLVPASIFRLKDIRLYES